MAIYKKYLKKINSFFSNVLGIKFEKESGKFISIEANRTLRYSKNGTDLNNLDISEYLSRLDKIFIESIKEPNFLSTTKKPTPLNVDINDSVRSIKLSIPTAQNFHLHSVEMFDKNQKPVKTPAKTKVKVSSQTPQYDKLSDDEHKKRLFAPNGKHIYAFYTKNVKNSWVEIIFPKNIDISYITINNVKKHIDPREHGAQKALGLRVYTSKDSKLYSLAYTLGGIKNFDKAAIKLAQQMKLYKYKNSKELFDFTVAVMKHRKLVTKKLFKTIPKNYRKKLSKALNDNVLYSRNMEWTSHGVRRSFRFWSKAEKQEYVVEATKLMNLLKELSPDVCLAFGSVLAVVRDKDFMPHDDDVDTWIAFKKSQISTYTEGFELIRKHIEPHGYTIRANVFNLSKVGIGNCKIDVFVSIYDDDGTLGLYPNARHVLKRSDIFPAQKVTFLGEKTYLPKDSEKYLAYTYGPNWRTPDPNFKYKRDKSVYADIAK